LTVTPKDGTVCRSILSITPVFYFVIPSSVSPIVISPTINSSMVFGEADVWKELKGGRVTGDTWDSRYNGEQLRITL
jgi:hypothetical protein